jgi:HlyD family secretion protein
MTVLRFSSWWRSGEGGRWGVVAAAIALVLVVLVGFRAMAGSAPDLPTATARQADFTEFMQLSGEVKALKSVVLSAPMQGTAFGDLRIIKLARNGAKVAKGEVVVQFDTMTLQRTIAEKRSELKSAEAEIERTRAQARIQQEQIETDLLKARYNVERARLDAAASELLSAVEGEQKKLALSDSEQRLLEIEERLKAETIVEAANVASGAQKRDKALAEVAKAERDIAAMTLLAPSDGMVNLLQNWRSAGMMGTSAPEFREGDRAWPGAPIAELPDLSTALITARLDESDRSRLRPGQPVIVRFEALPDTELPGQVSEIGVLARVEFGSWPPARNFDLFVAIDRSDPRLRPGMTASLRILVDRVPDALLVPVAAAFSRDGRTIAYVRQGRKFREREIEISRRGPSDVAVASGLQPGDVVALADPYAADPPKGGR